MTSTPLISSSDGGVASGHKLTQSALGPDALTAPLTLTPVAGGYAASADEPVEDPCASGHAKPDSGST